MSHGVFGPHHYARGKMNEIIREMAVSGERSQKRVYQATSTLLSALGRGDFPPPLDDEYEAILKAVAPYCAVWGPGGFENLDLEREGKKMMPRTARKLLARIWDLGFELLERTDELGFPRP